MRAHAPEQAPVQPTSGLRLWDSVKVITEGHPRHGQAGSVQLLDASDPLNVGVLFDERADDTPEESIDKFDTVAAADLERL